MIYTRSLPPLVAVIWSGFFNFLGVITSSGLVAYAIVSLLPVELILQAGSSAGYAMIFALLIAAIIWNLGTWAFGIPNSSSHALIGSILGVGLANQLMAPAGAATSGVQWDQAIKVIKSLLFSPIVGFALSALLLLVLRAVLGRASGLFKAPEGNKPPPPADSRILLVLTCTGVSFFHGSAMTARKVMGLIMLILIGAAPTAYALQPVRSRKATTPHFVPGGERRTRKACSAGPCRRRRRAGHGSPAAARTIARRRAGQSKEVNKPGGCRAPSPSLTRGHRAPGQELRFAIKSSAGERATSNVRNDMYLASDAVRVMGRRSPAGYSARMTRRS